jgi:hypothetical protein
MDYYLLGKVPEVEAAGADKKPSVSTARNNAPTPEELHD